MRAANLKRYKQQIIIGVLLLIILLLQLTVSGQKNAIATDPGFNSYMIVLDARETQP